MQLIDTVEGFAKALESERASGRSVGLVPTMGFLHEGHLSMIRKAGEETDVVAVTVFVNPLQFESREDLQEYPRDLGGDRAKAEAAGAGYLFAPSLDEMYPRARTVAVTLPPLCDLLEGRSRPGHLQGVATVVTKLFAMAGRCRAYFGEKDYQQLLVVRRLAGELSFPVDVVACPTVREPDGLALSSRNARLSHRDRMAAGVLWRSLCRGRDLVSSGERDPLEVSRQMAGMAGDDPSVSLDYAAVADPDTLERPEAVCGEIRLLIAARVGQVRLIDNLSATSAGDDSGGNDSPKGVPCDDA